MQLEMIRQLQELRAPWLTFVLELLTTFGSPQVYIVLLPLLFWCLSPREGFRFILVVLVATYLNSLLKDLGPLFLSEQGPLYATRPYLADPDTVWTCRRDPAFDPNAVLARLCREEETNAFPSGHAQAGIVFWGYLALRLRRWAFTILAVAMIGLIGLSRLYLGQHWPTDVLGGWLIGLVVLGAAWWLFGYWQHRPRRLDRYLLAALALIIPVLLVLDPDPTLNRARALGVVAGASLGYAVQRQAVPFVVRAAWPVQILKIVIGLAGIALIQLGLGLLLAETNLIALVLSLLTGLWATLGAPVLFRRLFGAPADVQPEAHPAGTRPRQARVD